MNEDFEQTLRKINEVAKKDEPNQGELRNVEKGLKNYEVNNLYEFQLEKRMIMDDMHDKLRAIDEGKEVSGFTSGEKRMVGHWNEEKRSGTITLPSGETAVVTPGDLMTDGVWGVSYKLDKDVPRIIKKEYVITEAKRYLMDVLANQIGHRKPGSLPRRAEFEKPYDGFIAEKLVETFIEKIAINSDLPIELEEVDLDEDMKRANDFVLHVPKYNKTGEEIGTEKKDIGVQLTISTNESNIRNKQNQKMKAKNFTGYTIHLDDIVLVNVPLKNCVDTYDLWLKNGMRPGGPAELWENEQKELIFRTVLKEIIPEEKINEMWEKTKDKTLALSENPGE